MTLARSTGLSLSFFTCTVSLVVSPAWAAIAPASRQAASKRFRPEFGIFRLYARGCYHRRVVPARRLYFGGVTDSTGLNRGGEACRVPSSRKTIGKPKLPIRSLH